MKKLFYSLFAFAALAMTNTSCSDELENAGTNANEVAVTFNVQLENTTGSRAAIGDGTTATELQYAVYKADGNGIGTIIKSLSKETTVKPDLTAEVTFRLVKGQTYNFMFWAQKPGVSATDEIADNAYYKVDKTLGKVSIDYKTNKDANDEGRDAFYAVEKSLKVTGPINKTIILKRPFAQINVGTTIGSLKDAATADVNITKSSMTIKKAANKLDIYTGKVSASADAEDVTYTLTNIPELTEAPTDAAGGLKNVTINNETKDYEYLAMNYILVDDHNTVNNVEDGSNNASVNVDFTIYDDKDVAINTFEVPNVTVQRNWRTNIIGDIMNENVTFNVVIDPKFDNDHNYDVATNVEYAFANGGTVTLTEDFTTDKQMEVKGNVILDLGGKSMTVNPTGSKIAIKIAKDAKLTIKGAGSVNTSATLLYAVYGDLEIQSGSHNAGLEAVEANEGKVIITGGEFKTAEKYNNNCWTLNLKDNTGAQILVYGGVFYQFNPANNVSEGAGTNFVAEGYKSVKDAAEDIYYVAKESTEVVTSMAELNTALATADAEVALVKDVTATATVSMAAGTTLDGVGNTLTLASDDDGTYARGISTKGGTIKNLVIDGENKKSAKNGKGYRAIFIEYATEDVVIDNVSITGVAYTMNSRGIDAADNLKLAVTNSTLVGWTSYVNFASASFDNCHFGVGSYYDAATIASNPGWNGCIRPYDTTTLNNCTFDAGFILMLDNLSAGETITLKNCLVGNVVVTKDNIQSLLGVAYDDEVIKF